ncbi:hypothetical protein [Paraglaciecola sp. L1A13]|uniref:hypothetical protein n=1 Tax=Paraglaciecola sp. L1A13 TaxID=2686359 RepID=UPI00131B3443|nr:hypothetical protein [Paraglaciecola sp. L1A13]
MEILLKYLSEVIAFLALIVSLYAGFNSYKANKLANQNAAKSDLEKAAMRRKNMMIAEEKKLSVTKKLIFAVVQKHKLLSTYPSLEEKYPKEKERLILCLDALKYQEKDQPRVEKWLSDPNIGKPIELSNSALAYVERLTIRMETDLISEERTLKAMEEMVRNA